MALLQSVVNRLTGKFSSEQRTEKSLRGDQALLKQLEPIFPLMEQRQIVEVVCIRTGERYQSMILEVNLADRYLELDEFFLSRARHIHLPGEAYSVVHQSNGELLSFDVRIVAVIPSSRGPLYRVSLPSDISLRQRRNNRRLALSRNNPMCVKLASPGQPPWYATAINISSGGMRVVVGGNVVDSLYTGKRLQQCDFKFTDKIAVSCEARVCGFRFNRKPFRQTELSIRFMSLSSAVEKEINTLIEHCSDRTEAA